MIKTVLVTGGAGYVGSHSCKAFAQAGWNVVVLDNLSRGWRDFVRWGPFVEADIADTPAVTAALDTYKPDVVAHFAAYAYVGESIAHPDLYYRNNTAGTLSLLQSMNIAGCKRILFSSTCASYGNPVKLPIAEDHPQSPINPYGYSKLFAERIISDFAAAYGFSGVALRYFNAAGCDIDGEIGERHEPETHAIPLALAAALSPVETFSVFGTDFDTRDGSPIRDYVHVADLATAHVLAAERLLQMSGFDVFNLGSETGTSVLEIVAGIERVTGRKVNLLRSSRREGDPASLVATAAKARNILGWQPRQSDIETILETAARWQARRLERT